MDILAKSLSNKISIIGFREKSCPGSSKIRAKTQTEKKKISVIVTQLIV